MPHIPQSPPTQSLSARLTTLSDANKSIAALIQRLAKLDFQPGSQPLDAADGDGDVRLELSAEIHESLKSVEEELELLRQEVEDFVGGGAHGAASPVASVTGGARRRDTSAKEAERSRVAVLLARLTEDLRLSRTQYRRAQLSAKHAADRARLKERELLFASLQSGASSPTSTYRRRKHDPALAEGEIVQQASSDVTGALRRTHQLMQSELSRSRFAQETLEQSTVALADLGEKYSDLSTLLASSRTLVTTLLKSQKSDTWYLETTFYVLLTTLIWLAFRRWFYGPLTWFVVWPIKLAYYLSSFILSFCLSLVGVKSSSSSLASSASASTSLIVQPSATGGIPRRPSVQAGEQRQPAYARVGGFGGARAAKGDDPSPPHSLSQSVGQMAEQQQQKSGHEDTEQQQPVVRGDGTVLAERGADKPRNPKKKMWEEGAAGDQAPAAAAEEKGGRLGKRDEL